MAVKEYLIPENLYYDQNDFWIKIEANSVLIGITEEGQKNTGDILYLELAPAGTVVRRGEKIGSIESGKWVGNLTAPLSGAVAESNPAVTRNPRLVNRDAYGEGWMVRLIMDNPDELGLLMGAREYEAWLDEQLKSEEGIG
jgi:glycine cleavage system H protein